MSVNRQGMFSTGPEVFEHLWERLCNDVKRFQIDMQHFQEIMQKTGREALERSRRYEAGSEKKDEPSGSTGGQHAYKYKMTNTEAIEALTKFGLRSKSREDEDEVQEILNKVRRDEWHDIIDYPTR